MSGSGTRRTTILKRRAGKTARLIFYAKRAGLVIVILGAVTYGVKTILNSMWFSRTEERTVTSFHDKMAGAGFKVRGLMIDGRHYTNRKELKSALGVQKDESIFIYDITEMRDKLSRLPWVKEAVVERRLPDTIYVKLNERRPVALYQKEGKLSLVDAEGVILTDKDLESFKSLIVITGENAPQNAPELMGLINAEPDLKERIEIARWIGNRRWDIRLKNGITLRLPEDDAGLAIKRLAEAQKTEQVLDRHLEAIDLRDPMRIVVQTSPGDAQKYDASFKKEKNI
ncbi:MAG: cell division protein FtsQ [Micavibrio aeruginosavorus]|uniref:Cell division protein FtsQ n=1 Tax=Micavibrio aeruginosavorus TaxID=349221 RepID=A0A2W5FL64_9BACT|nr:MAG: cell division protein FtsQ [Micavibrio aeruginosavorus]